MIAGQKTCFLMALYDVSSVPRPPCAPFVISLAVCRSIHKWLQHRPIGIVTIHCDPVYDGEPLPSGRLQEDRDLERQVFWRGRRRGKVD